MRRVARTLLWSLCILVLFSIVLMLFLPTILSTEWGKNHFLKNFNEKVHGHLAVDKMQLGWFSSQNVSGITLFDQKGEKVLSIDHILFPAPLLKLWWNPPLDFTVSNLNAKIEWFNLRQTNFDEIFNLKAPSSHQAEPLSFAILENVHANFSSNNKQAVASGLISNGNQSGHFQLTADLYPSLRISADIKNLPVELLELFAQKEVNLKQMIGQALNLSIKQKRMENISEIEMKFYSRQAEGKVEGIVQNSSFTLAKPAQVSVQATPALNQFLFNDQVAFNLSDKIQFDIRQLDFSCNDPIKAEVQATVNLPTLENSDQKNTFHFEGVEFRLAGDFEKKIMHYKVQGQMQPTRQNEFLPKFYFYCAGKAAFEKDRPFLLTYEFEGFQTPEKSHPILKMDGTWGLDLLHKKRFSAKGFAQNFPLSYLKLGDFPPALQVALGPLLQTDFSLTLDDIAQQKGYLKFTAKGNEWQSEGSLALDEQLKVVEPLKGNFILHPKAFDQLQALSLPQNSPQYALLQPCEIQFKVNKGIFPLLEGKNWKMGIPDSSFDFNCVTTPLQVVNLSAKKQFSFPPLNLKLSSDNIFQDLKFSLSAEEDSQRITLIAKGLAENFIQDEKIHVASANLELDVNMLHFPLSSFAKLMTFELLAKKIEALVGSEVSANLSAKIQHLQGPMQLSVSGENGKLALDGQLEKGRLMLAKPLHIQVKATPQFGREILADILPPFSQVIRSDEMLKIIVDPKDFSLTLHPLDWTSMQLAKGTLILGKMAFVNNGVIRTLQTFFKINDSSELTVWFTPLYFSMKKGNLKLERMDMLFADHYPIALWGNIFLPQDKVKLIIGIRQPAIHYAFGIQNLPSDYVLQIPLTGTINKASIDLSKAAGKISALIAKSQKNSTGQLVGTFLDLVSGKLKEEKAPPPTTTPFPWE
ncbi:hypothetical protein [Parachlamydia sp. AcF125]|uniref:hypothetical protein n=1 Tax=Parachlamydia sp. AcF125 TaxID=2795736 RepID=UPI001BD84F41|nr:hypothetical protein [Parachlamydia sp. AcF125]MBS4168449.1 hypothetical protein [Parachlamydia sp. AcF125]